MDGGNYNDTIFLSSDEGILGFTCEWGGINRHQLKMFKLMDNNVEFSDPDYLKTLDYYLTRPAGKIFYDEYEKKILMVSQICNPMYGSGLIFKQFSIAFPHYEEQEVARIYPADINCDLEKLFDGIHTFNMSENYLTIDVIWSRFNLIEKASRIVHRLIRKEKR